MTSGTKRVGDSSALGSYFYKTWNGGDAPKQSSPPPIRLPATAYYAWVKNSKGTMERKLFWHKGKILRPARRARDLSPHPYSASGYSGTNVSYQASNPGCPPPTKQCTFRSSAGSFGASNIDSNVEISLISQLADSLRGGQFDASVFLGTGIQSLDTITQSASRIASAIRSVRRGDMATAARTLTGKQKAFSSRSVKTEKAVSSAWLELQYGWLPLVSDVYDSGTWLAKLLNDPLRFRVKVSKSFTNETPADRGSNPSFTRWTVSNKFEVLSYVAYFKEEPSTIAKLGLTNPANLAWELLPWSFVADWFAPVGGYLDARGVQNMLPNATYVRTRFSRCSGQGLSLSATPAGYFGIHNAGGASFSQWSMTRTVSSSLSVPRPEFKPLGEVLNWRRAANAVALLVGMKSFNP